MKDPPRLQDECRSPLERALLRAGMSYRSSPQARIKTLAAFGFASSVAVTAGTASPAVLGGLTWAKLAGVVALAGTVTAVPVSYYVWRTDSQPLAPPSRRISVPQPKAPAATKPEPAHQRVETSSEPAALPAKASSLRPAPARTSPQPSTLAPDDALSAELAALDGARSALAAGNPTGALSRLDAYSKAHPRGRLALEAEVLRIDALARNGQTQAAKAWARAFLRQRPKSVLASRVRAHLED